MKQYKSPIQTQAGTPIHIDTPTDIQNAFVVVQMVAAAAPAASFRMMLWALVANSSLSICTAALIHPAEQKDPSAVSIPDLTSDQQCCLARRYIEISVIDDDRRDLHWLSFR